jgi:hypothetical protein
MKGRNLLLAVPVLVLAIACENPQQPVGLRAPSDASMIINDGAHGAGNPDFFFLPPLVPLPTTADFADRELNKAIAPSLTVEICRLKPDKLDGQHLPTPETPCYENGPFYRFGPGEVVLVDNPTGGTGTEWWRGLGLPDDGFYYVLWDTREAHLNAEKFYRVKVFIAGSNVPLGVADIDPMKKESELQSSAVEVIQVLNGVMLPIPFRVEGHALCEGATLCTSSTVTNESPTGSQTVVVDPGGGSIAGATFPNGWLPEGGPQSVVVTITEIPSPEADDGSHVRTIPCHVGLPLQQFNKCFTFTTTPQLATDVNGDQFAEFVTVAVCYTLEGSGNPREEHAQLYASGPRETTRALDDADDAGILGPGSRNCSAPPPITLGNSNPLTRLATTGWRGLKGALGQFFGVKTAYGVDLGLGGIVKGFTTFGVALSANIEGASTLNAKLAYGEIRQSAVKIRAPHFHPPIEGPPVTGIDGVPVTFTLSAGGGFLSLNGGEGTELPVKVMSSAISDFFLGIDGPGFAEIFWTMPSTRGIHTLTAESPAFDSPITFTDTVRGARLMLSMQTGATFQIVTPAPTVNTWVKVGSSPSVTVSPTGLVTAVVGGENINGGNDVTLTSDIGGVEAHSALVNSFAFDVFPRQTTLVWASVAGAATYDVVTEFGNGCGVGGNCGTWTSNGPGTGTTTGTSLTFGFVGSQPGRWHVVAKDGAGNVLSTSAFVYFGYNI